MGKLTNKVVLVTGAGTGIGREIAKQFADEGARIVLTGRREEKLREVSKEIGNDDTIVIPADLTKENSVQALFSDLEGKTDGKLDILVNNAGGVSAMGTTSELSLDDWQDMFEKNATTQFLATKEALPLLRKSEAGKIISVTSGMVNFFMEGMGSYSASKAASEMLMKTVAVEEEKNNIQVNLFDPLNAKTEGNPDGAHEPKDIVGVLVDLAASKTVVKNGEIIKPEVD